MAVIQNSTEIAEGIRSVEVFLAVEVHLVLAVDFVAVVEVEPRNSWIIAPYNITNGGLFRFRSIECLLCSWRNRSHARISPNWSKLCYLF